MVEKRRFAAGHAWPYLHRSNRRQPWARAQSLYCWPFVRPECGPPLTLRTLTPALLSFHRILSTKGFPEHRNMRRCSATLPSPGCTSTASNLCMKVMPHWHPDTVRTVLVMSGTFYFAVGEQWDESKLKAYPAGTLYSEPARSPHYAWAKDGEVILQVTAIGPTGNVPIPQKGPQ